MSPAMLPPLRLALATIEYPPQAFSSGIGTYTRNLAEGLAERGHTVHVVSRGADRDAVETVGGVTIDYVTPARAELPEVLDTRTMAAFALRGIAGEIVYRRKVAARLHRLVAQGGFQLVEAADHLGEAAWYDPDRHPGVPFVVRLHTPMAYSELIDRVAPRWVTAVASSMERRQAGRATHLTCPTSITVEPFLAALRLDGRHVSAYPNPNRIGASEPCPNPPGPPVVLFVGRLNAWKGADTLMRAAGEVLRDRPDARIELAGAVSGQAPSQDRYVAHLRSLIDPAVRERVEFLGRLDSAALVERYRRATVCVFPSRFENQSYTCLEAMSFGKAIVGSSEGGMRELLEDGAAGLLHDPPDPLDLARHIGRLLDDPGLRARLGLRAHQRANGTFDLERSLDAAEAFYRRAIASLRPSGA